MKSTIKSMWSLVLAAAMLFTVACQDTVEDPDFDQGEFTMESFPDLTVEELNNIETPFQDALNSSGGRSLNDEDPGAVIAALLEILEGATIIEIEEGQERGLDVIKAKILLANDALIEIVVATANLKILEVEGHRGPFDYDIDAGGNFITLQEGLQAALGAQEGEIVRWELELELDDNNENRWELEVHIVNNDVRYEVEVDAFTGEVLAVNEMDATDDDEFEDEEKEEELPQAVVDAVAAMISGEIIYAESEEENGEVFWEVLVETASEAVVHLALIENNLELIFAGDEEGPFDYDLNPGEGYLTLAEVIEVVEGELQAETYYWYFETREDAAGETGKAYFIKVIDAAGNYHKVGVNAVTGDWFDVDGDGDGDDELPENIATAVSAIIDAEVIEFDKEELDNGESVWLVYVKTESGAVIELIITDDTEDLIYAGDEHGPFDYDLLPADGFLTLQDAITPVAEEFQAEIYYWYFEDVETDTGETKWAYVLKIITENDEFVRVTVDAQTGDWLKTEDFREPELPTEIAEAINSMIDAEIIEHHKDQEGDGYVWYVYVKTESQAEVKLVFSNENYELIYAKDEHGPFDYELTIGGNFRLLSENLDQAASLFTVNDTKAEVQNWKFDIVDRDATGVAETYAFIIEVKSADERFWRVSINAKTGDFISEEEID